MRSYPREVFILGAGFSRAVSSRLPVTDELGNEVIQRDPTRLGRSVGKQRFAGGSFETWLSRRAEAQPYLTAEQNLESQSIFARGTRLIGEVLDQRVGEALASPMPAWLGELISLWHHRSSSVLTFNYDTLIECAFQTMRFWDWRHRTSFQWGSILNYTPEGKGGLSYAESDGTGAPHPSFRLRKLHGSLNWFWSPGDTAGATVRRARLPGDFMSPNPIPEDEMHWIAPGRERFIVPPAALKSSYYQNPIVREIWQRSNEALQEADVITLMGYSVPVTDLSTTGMLAEALQNGGKEVRIVDAYPRAESDPTSVAARVRNLAGPNTTIENRGCGEAVVADYVERLVAEAGNQLVADLASTDQPRTAALHVDWGEASGLGRAAAVVDVRRNADTITVTTDPLSNETRAFESRRGSEGHRAIPKSLQDLLDLIEGSSRILVRVPGGDREATAIHAEPRPYDTGHSNEWLQLVTAGQTWLTGIRPDAGS
ncbi:hypothetical protein IT072_01595 [Leifsonia sp. ZF2019]|uniref:hypothetical protein n=1 Tax=Leifsonia sp. ZF2019 TaxID=2781978 RepID=UPI001CBFC85D|nr:hypothetical protein [Leifsonia sp. ZF2019]UAJ79804.1 hypothetical protein IT072_01595 [Leifsonia sp. ZF2019]